MMRANGLWLRLYPKSYREKFAAEIEEVFRAAAEEERRRGVWAYFRFLAREAAGLLAASGTEWAKVLKAETEAVPVTEEDLPPEIAALRMRIAVNLRRMEYAIAHHQFPQARLCSEIDVRERARLGEWFREHRPQS